jgi:hypothetical protein
MVEIADSTIMSETPAGSLAPIWLARSTITSTCRPLLTSRTEAGAEASPVQPLNLAGSASATGAPPNVATSAPPITA